MKSCSGSIKAEELLYLSGQTDNSIHFEETVMDAIIPSVAVALAGVIVSLRLIGLRLEKFVRWPASESAL